MSPGIDLESIDARSLEHEDAIEFPCIRCGGEVGDPLTELCEACLEPDPDAALYLEEGR